MESPEATDTLLPKLPDSEMGGQISSGSEEYLEVNPEESDSEWKLILPDLSEVVVGGGKVAHDGVALAQFTLLERTASLAISAFGTPFEESNPVPHYPVVDITQAEESSGISKEAMWIIIYVLFSTMKDQETIPISIQKTGNKEEVARYILCSGLGRKHPHPTGDLFLSRAAFWQGAGTSAHNLGWLREYADVVANFPLVDDFTRSDKVIASHPLRPPKPPPGALLYRRYCPHLKQMYELNYIDVDNKDHVQAFHRWHNSERVNKAWGEAGSLETHTEYIKKQMDDPHCWPVLGSWDGDLMGYYELTWVKVSNQMRVSLMSESRTEICQ